MKVLKENLCVRPLVAVAALLTVSGVATQSLASSTNDAALKPAATSSTVSPKKTILTGEDLPAIEEKVKAIVAKMTLDEKIRFMSGEKEKLKYDGPPPVPRIGIPEYIIAHGPFGARSTFVEPETNKKTLIPGTFFGVSMNYAACWDPELVQKVTQAFGKEIRCAGNHAAAGPAFNIVRDLRCGRVTEYFTEDPYLNARTVVPFVLGLQDEQVVATLKHYACNNQEFARGLIDVIVSKRALNEIYLPAFEYAVTEADAMSVMSSYNKVNGAYAAENDYLLNDRLRKTWGFKGFVMSDWSGTHSTVPTVKAGLDLEMPRPSWYGQKLKQAVESGEVSEELINERVGNILRTMFIAKCFDKDFPKPPVSVFKSPEHKELARQLALNSIVLLKNEGNVLPFDRNAVKKVAVIGPHSSYGPHFNGGKYDITLFQMGGSANVKSPQPDMITPLQGIKAFLGDSATVSYSPGCYAENGCGPIDSKYLVAKDGTPGLSATYYEDAQFEKVKREGVDPTVSFEWDQDPLVPEAGRPVGSAQKFSVRWEGKLNVPATREYTFEFRYEGKAALFIDGKEVYRGVGSNDDWWTQTKVQLTEGSHDIKLEYQKNASKGIMKFWWDFENVEWIKDAVSKAKNADVVILNVGNSGNAEREGRDRFQGLLLSPAQENLIKAVSAVNKKTVVVTFTGGVGMDNWIKGVPGVFQAMYPGEQVGNALAELVFGAANPNGKLTVTIPTSEAQYPEGYWGKFKSIEYKEGVFVGYRYFDQNNIEPQFPFGHGLSYTTFAYGTPKVSKPEAKAGDSITVTLDITNKGNRAGAEVVQLYVHDLESSVPRPPKELKAFKKVFLNPGETKTVTLELDKRSFAFFDENKDDWVVEPGKFDLLIGSSSRDIRQKTSCTMK